MTDGSLESSAWRARIVSLKRALGAVFLDSVPPTAPWSLPRRIGFRFVLLYLGLSYLPQPFEAIPGISTAAAGYYAARRAVGVWVATHLFHAHDIATTETGSGDTAEAWSLAFCFGVVAVLGAIAWSIAAPRAKEHARLLALQRVWLRYLLASILLSYGLSKVFRIQFQPPSFDDLLETYGESTPMHLLWTFMGASTPYTIFAGAAETVGALLLLWRRTVTLGALVLAGVMVNVVMLNLCYDVPVKLHATQLLFIALFVAAPDMGRLADVLVLGRAASASPMRATGVAWAERTRLAIKLAFVGTTLFAATSESVEEWRKWGAGAPKPLLTGIYDVESFLRNGTEVAPLLGDEPAEKSRWRTVVFNEYPAVTFYGIGGRRRRYREEVNEATSTLSLKNKLSGELSFVYSRPDAEHLTLEGTIDGQVVLVHLRRRPSDASVGLVNRGFRWVTEFPDNR
jgi:uncharacterized membrane protein YphA (DoxX/SURF4 family)